MTSIARGWLSLRGAAAYTGMSTSVVSRAVHGGELPAYKAGKSFRISVNDLDAWMRSFPRVKEVRECSIS